ncbi:MAG: creatininase family protein [Pseudomonadota bacterium]|nr:MAG: creatininase family protein [Pseudomonadota bacterium]
MMRGIRVAEVAWPEVLARIEAGATAVLPVGAACKAHGRHLPMGTDQLQAEWLGAALAERAPVLVWPTVSYGHYPAFVDYPGSCSLELDTFRALVEQILRDILRAGVQRVLIINTGISTVAPLQQAKAHAGGAGRIVLCNVYEGARYRALAARTEQQVRGGHADELETSIMLNIAPKRVDMANANRWDTHEISGVFSRTDPSAPGYSPDGVYGDPTLADADKGWKLLHAMLQDILEALNQS